jgi:hypothetical protein
VTSRHRSEAGFAVIVAMMAILLMSALGTALVLATSLDSAIARNFRGATAVQYAAEAVATHGIYELSAVGDWSQVLAGSTRSHWFDNPSGVRVLRDGSRINLTEIHALLNCGRLAVCSHADMTAATAARPWGPNNPRWQPFAGGDLAALIPAAGVSGFYGVLFVADDPAETDGDPLVDGSSGNPGAGVLVLRAEAFGPGGSRAAVELTLARLDASELAADPRLLGTRVVSWRAGR